MSYLTKYGTYFGRIPLSLGRVHYVAPSSSYTVNGRTYASSDNHDGLSPERALATVGQAITNATADAGEIIFLLRGTHTVTATVAVSKSGLTFWGETSSEDTVPARPVTILTSTGTSDELLNITASNAEFGYLTIRPTSGFDGVSFQTDDGALSNPYFHHCHFDLYTPTANVQTNGINFAARSSSNTNDLASISSANVITGAKVYNCTFESDGAQGRAVKVASAHVDIRDCTFIHTAGTWATALEYATGSDNCYGKNLVFISSGTLTVNVSGAFASEAGGVTLEDCTVTGADAIRGFTAGECRLVNCFVGSTANGTASTTAISRMNG